MVKLFKTVEEVESPFNGKIQVVRDLNGTRLVVGGISQSGWLVRKVWKEALKKIKKERENFENVLILGLGGGSAAELVEEYWPEAKIVGVDIDPAIVSLGKRYMNLSGVSNLEIIEADAEEWVKESKDKFGLVLVDLYKGGRIPKQFRKPEFLAEVRGLVEHAGVAAFNHLYSNIEKEDAQELESLLREIFPVVFSIQPEANIVFICFKG